MGLNDTVTAERLHIAFFGVRNAGKSSLVNAVTNQEMSVVSEVMGTTTDPVKKTMELLPLGPVVIIDTPGIDDEGDLGSLRVKRALSALDYADIAVLVADATKGLCEDDKKLIAEFEARKTPYIVAYNKADLLKEIPEAEERAIYVSALTEFNIRELKEKIGSLGKNIEKNKPIAADLIKAGGTAVLVVPIDSAAPKGRLILPQQQTLRDLLDAGDIAVVCRDGELEATLKKLSSPPDIVITDSQAFRKVAAVTPPETALTSFSILMARYKGNLRMLVEGVARLKELNDGDKVLIAEACTHHRQCEDIGTVKIPKLVKAYTGKELSLEWCSGGGYPDDLSKYKLIIHCGGCMLNEKEMVARLEKARKAGVPVTNYGVTIAETVGVLRRSLEPFPEILKILG